MRLEIGSTKRKQEKEKKIVDDIAGAQMFCKFLPYFLMRCGYVQEGTSDRVGEVGYPRQKVLTYLNKGT